MSDVIPSNVKHVLERTWHLNRVHNGPEFSRAIAEFASAFSSIRGVKTTVHQFKPGEVYNHWIIPQRWHLKKFQLRDDTGKVLASHEDHPLVVASFSESVSVKLSLAELKQRIFTREDLPTAYSFHFRLMYRHWERDWKLCLPYKLVSGLKEGSYHVEIETERTNEPMEVLEVDLPGETDRIVAIAAHLDHPGLVNDSLSGCVSALQMIQFLAENFPKRKYSYKALLVPEIIGSAAYLKRHEDLVSRIDFAFCPNEAAHDAPFAFCKSRLGGSMFDLALEQALRESGAEFKVGAFHQYPDCGDEIAFDIVGYEIPTSTLSRIAESFPFYHCSLDNLENFLTPAFQARYQEYVGIICRAVEMLEKNLELKALFSGLPCLSNPALDLYLEPSNINNQLIKSRQMKNLASEQVDPRMFMEYFLGALMEKEVSALEIAYRTAMPFDFVLSYAEKFSAKGLLELNDCRRRYSKPILHQTGIANKLVR